VLIPDEALEDYPHKFSYLTPNTNMSQSIVYKIYTLIESTSANPEIMIKFDHSGGPSVI
jgi:hypothetical protein